NSPLTLPVKTKIIIPKLNHTIDHIMINPTENISKLYDLVDNYFINLGDEIVSREENCGLYIKRKENIIIDINSELKENSKDIKLDPNTLVLSADLLQGETIYFIGNYILKSEAPKNCITYEFDKYKDTSVNFFSCE